MPRLLKRKKPFHPVRVITLGFSALILLGTVLLAMPFATRSGQSAGLMTALFTSTSATCVTGLVVEDTWLFWSPAGQAVILALIQAGGLGFMMVAAGFSFLVGRRITIRERLLIGKSLNVDDLSGIVRLARGILLGTFAVEGIGAVLLSIRFARDFGLRGGIVRGVWTSVSAFCNAGFDLMGSQGAYSSLSAYLGDPAVTLTVSLLICIGGLGFYVWADIVRRPPNGRLRLHTWFWRQRSFCWLSAPPASACLNGTTPRRWQGRTPSAASWPGFSSRPRSARRALTRWGRAA